MDKFVDVFRRECRKADFSQRQIAEDLGVSAVAVYYWASGRSIPTIANCGRLERLLKCAPGTLLLPLAYAVEGAEKISQISA